MSVIFVSNLWLSRAPVKIVTIKNKKGANITVVNHTFNVYNKTFSI